MRADATAACRVLTCLLAIAAGLGADVARAASARPADELLGLINLYRSDNRFCDGKTLPPAPPLAPDAALAGLPLARGSDLEGLLRKSGYRAARAQAIVISGPRDAASAMGVLRNKYCQAVLGGDFAQVGIARDGRTWHIVLAQPLLSPQLGDWREAGFEILRLTNAARSQARACGDRNFAPAPPLAWDARLAQAAFAHSLDMARRNYFSHTDKSGRRVGGRADDAGYAWQRIGENIATGQGSPERAMAGWLASPPHCANLMNPAFSQMGAAYALDTAADTAIYWTQVFGSPR